MFNNGISSSQDMPGRAIVLFQTNHFNRSKIMLEMGHVFDPRTAPAVNRLIIIAHGDNLLSGFSQKPKPTVLNCIGILKFVH